jgi:hypothetical protein
MLVAVQNRDTGGWMNWPEAWKERVPRGFGYVLGVLSAVAATIAFLMFVSGGSNTIANVQTFEGMDKCRRPLSRLDERLCNEAKAAHKQIAASWDPRLFSIFIGGTVVGLPLILTARARRRRVRKAMSDAIFRT